jgi:general secretion pathway protein K
MIGNRGVALVIVLWALTVIAVIAANFTTANRDGLFLARNTVERAKAEALADAGFYRAVLAIVSQEAEPRAGDGAPAGQPGGLASSLRSVRAGIGSSPDLDNSEEQFGELGPPTWRTNGKIYEWPLGEGTVLISIQDEAGKIDLNAATEGLLLQLFSAIDLPDQDPATMVDRLIDYRDADQERRPLGAEDIDYQRANLGYGAKDRPFERTDELRRVLGVTLAMFAQISPLVTVHSGQRGVDPNVAPAGVLGVLSAAVEQLEDPLRAADDGNRTLSSQATRRQSRANRSSSRERAFTIKTEARTAGGGVFVRQAIVELTGDRDQPITVRQWEQARSRISAPVSENAGP